DAHHHFWYYKRELFPWITPERMIVGRDFLPEEFKALIDENKIEGSVVIQNFRTLDETDWLFKYAETNAWIKGVVAWFPLSEPDIEEVIDSYLEKPALVGAREILQLPEASGLFESTDFHNGLEVLAKQGLVYDLLIGPWQFRESIQLADTHPNLRIVLSHLGKPPIADGELEQWKSDFQEIAKRPNVVCKLSGLPLEAKIPGWTYIDLKPCIELALEVFGPDRLLFGSDWPPCLMATSYARWLWVVERALSKLSEDEQLAIWSGTASRIYGFD
ncbi:MAG: amidohydrolase family protein, partial [Verrucomicrobiota bacterium]